MLAFRPFLLLALLLSLSVSCCAQEDLNVPQTALTLVKLKSGKQKSFIEGQRMKVWLHNQDPVTGELIQMKKDLLILKTQEGRVSLALDEIVRIQMRDYGFREVSGAALAGLGAFYVGVGGGAVLIGTLSLIGDNLDGAIAILVGGVGLVAGAIVWKLGNIVRGNRFNMKHWQLRPPSAGA